MSRLKVGLNGFGRIGRSFARIAFERDDFDIVLINTRSTEPEMLSYLLSHDSIYGRFGKKVGFSDNKITVDSKDIRVNTSDTIDGIPWEEEGVDIVVDATGAFKNSDELKKHLSGTVKKVILTTVSKNDDMEHVVLGVNEKKIDFKNQAIISNCSCTTNSVAILYKILDEEFGVKSGFFTSSHSYTQSQSLHDNSAKDFSKARAATLNIIPSTTGASVGVIRTIPNLKDKIKGLSLRVPIAAVSFSDVTAILNKPTTKDEINKIFKERAENDLAKILGYSDSYLVSSDLIGTEFSTIFDSNYTDVIDENYIKITAWYDNEWGYSSRLADLVMLLGQNI